MWMEKGYEKPVSILVLVDRALRVLIRNGKIAPFPVSILVLVDRALRVCLAPGR